MVFKSHIFGNKTVVVSDPMQICRLSIHYLADSMIIVSAWTGLLDVLTALFIKLGKTCAAFAMHTQSTVAAPCLAKSINSLLQTCLRAFTTHAWCMLMSS